MNWILAWLTFNAFVVFYLGVIRYQKWKKPFPMRVANPNS